MIQREIYRRVRITTDARYKFYYREESDVTGSKTNREVSVILDRHPDDGTGL